VAFDFHAFDVWHDIIWEFRTFGADGSPVRGELCADVEECAGVCHVEGERKAVAVFGVDGVDVVCVSECSTDFQ
jgi:hypothetical protein